MRNLFHYDGVLSQIINKFADTFCLSVLWLLTCIPVFTAGAASAALYHTVNRVVLHENGKLWKEYWSAFRANFKQATVIWLLLLGIYYILSVSAYSAILLYTSKRISWLSLLFVAIPVILITMWAVYLLPSIARFQNTTSQIMKNCLLFSTMHFLPSLALVFLFALSIVIVILLPVSIFFVPVLCCYLSRFIIEHIFRSYMSAEDIAQDAINNGTNSNE